MEKFPLDSWKADQVRVSLFSPLPWQVHPESIFSELMSRTAESTASKPSAGEASALGSWGEYRLEIKRAINRLDFLIAPPPPAAPEIPLISNPAVLLQELSQKVAHWQQAQSQDIIRMAVGCGALFPIPNADTGNKKINELTGVFLGEMQGYRDLLIQLNKPHTSDAEPGLLVNRIVRSMIVKVEAGIFSVVATQPLATLFFATFATDVNTDGDRNLPLKKEKIKPLLKELTEKTIDLLANGGP